MGTLLLNTNHLNVPGKFTALPRQMPAPGYVDRPNLSDIPKVPACDWCREKKIRCGREKPQCRNCTSRRIRCVYSERTKRDNETSRTTNMFKEVHHRLDRMESTMERIAAALNVKHQSAVPLPVKRKAAKLKRTHLQDSENGVSGSSSSSSDFGLGEDSVMAADSRQEDSTQHTASPSLPCSFVKDVEGNAYYYGDTSVLAMTAEAVDKAAVLASSPSSSVIPTPTIQPSDLSEIQDRLSSLLSVDAYVQLDKPTRYRGSIDYWIPPLPDCEGVIADYFRTTAWLFPVFSPKNFTRQMEMMYSNPDAAVDVGWIISYLSTLIFGVYGTCNQRDMLVQEYMAGTARVKLLQKASKVIWEYLEDTATLLKPRLVNVQALMMMAICANDLSRPGLCWVLLCNACSLAKSLGLHRSQTHSSHQSGIQFTPEDAMERRYVFWSLYVTDKALSLTYGRPSSLPDYEIDAEMPDYDPENPLFDLYIVSIEIAKIQSEIHVNLYSAAALKAGDEEKRRNVIDLDRKLRDWWTKHASLLEKRNTEENFERRYAMTELTFSYHNNMIMIHRVHIQRDFQAMGSIGATQEDAFARGSPTESEVLSLEHARKSIDLIRDTVLQETELSNSTILMCLFSYYPLTTFFVLFSNIIRNPTLTTSKEDFHLLEFIINFLESMKTVHLGASKLLPVAKTFFGIASRFFLNHGNPCQQQQPQTPLTRKRKLLDMLNIDTGSCRREIEPSRISPSMNIPHIQNDSKNIDFNLTSFITCPTGTGYRARISPTTTTGFFPNSVHPMSRESMGIISQQSPQIVQEILTTDLNVDLTGPEYQAMNNLLNDHTSIERGNLGYGCADSATSAPFDFNAFIAASSADSSNDGSKLHDARMDSGGYGNMNKSENGIYGVDNSIQDRMLELAANEGPLDFNWFGWERYYEGEVGGGIWENMS